MWKLKSRPMRQNGFLRNRRLRDIFPIGRPIGRQARMAFSKFSREGRFHTASARRRPIGKLLRAPAARRPAARPNFLRCIAVGNEDIRSARSECSMVNARVAGPFRRSASTHERLVSTVRDRGLHRRRCFASFLQVQSELGGDARSGPSAVEYPTGILR